MRRNDSTPLPLAKQEAIEFQPDHSGAAARMVGGDALAGQTFMPPRFTVAVDDKHKFAFAVMDRGKRVAGNMSKDAARKEAARLEKELKGA